MSLNAVSLFAGIGGIDLALELAGIRVTAAVEIDAAARGVLADRFPQTTLFNDVREVTPDELRATGFDPDRGLLAAGWPCFVAGTRVLTDAGWKPIEDVRVGELVLTHAGRWRPVTSTMANVADHHLVVRGQGLPAIETTAEHPFFARAYRSEWVGHPHRTYRRAFDAPGWTAAEKMAGQFASQVLPPVEDDDNPADLWWLVGRYLADGWTTSGSRSRDRVYICCAHHEADELAERIATTVHATRAEMETATRFTITKSWFVDFVARLGRGAAGKTLTRRELALPPDKADALLSGWLSGDGSRTQGKWKGTTVSRSLALSMALLAQRARGVVASLHETKMPATTTIAGRVVGQRTQYQVVIPDRNRSAFVEGAYGWKLVRSAVRADGPVLVYNLSVAGDQSYVADGAVVHNCQDLSIAGLRAGLGGARSGLFWQVVRLLAGLRPRWFLLENVPGLLSAVCPGQPADQRGGPDQMALAGFDADERGGLTTGRGACPGGCMDAHGGAMGLVVGALVDLGYGVCWRVLDAQHFGVPQRRRRVVFVGCLGDGAAPVEVLLEPEGGRRDSAPGRPAGPGAAVVTALRAGGSRGSGPDDNDAQGGRLIIAPVRASNHHGDHAAAESQLVVGPLQAQGADGRGHRVDAEGAANGHLVAATLTAGSHASRAPGRRREDDDNLVATALTTRAGSTFDDHQAAGQLVAYTVQSEHSTAMTGNGAAAVARPVNVARSLDTTGGYATNQGGTVVAVDAAQITHRENRSNPQPGDPAGTLAAGGQPHVAYALRSYHAGAGQGHNTTYVPVGDQGVTHALTAEGSDASEDGTGRGTPLVAFDWQASDGRRVYPNISTEHTSTLATTKQDAVAVASAVRRLTPVECERLQGLPDGWTATSNGQPQSDSARYRQLGNSVAVPVFVWVASRIKAIDEAITGEAIDPAVAS